MEISKYDTILIPGGGVKKEGSVPIWTQSRLDKAIDIFTGDEFIITLSGGTTHKPPILDKNGFPIYESVAAANYLMDNSISPSKILTETASLDTIGNAYFARVIHTDPREFKKLLIITSQFHMPRTKVIFEWIYSLKPLNFNYQLDFIEASDKGIDPKFLDLRHKKEIESLRQLNNSKKNIETLSDFHQWLYTKHSAYTLNSKSSKIEGKILDWY